LQVSRFTTLLSDGSTSVDLVPGGSQVRVPFISVLPAVRGPGSLCVV
jgi:hypothetical protein